MKITTASVLILGFLLPLISAQLTYYDNGYPPAPATRRNSVRNGQLTGRRNAALQQAPIEQMDEPEPQTPQEPQQPQEIEEHQQPIVQEQVPTQRPLRNGNGYSQQPVPSRNGNGYSRPTNGNGFPRITQQTYESAGQTAVGEDEGSVQIEDKSQSQEQEGGTDAPVGDISTEKIVPGVVTTSEEDTSDDGFTPTEPMQRPLIANGQRKMNGNGQKPLNGNGRKTPTTNGQKPLNGNGKKANGNGKKANGNGQKKMNGIGQAVEAQRVEGDHGYGGDGGPAYGGDGGPSYGGSADHSYGGDGDHGSGGDGDHDHHSGDPIDWLRAAIRGEPGTDYPIFYTPPETGFKCTDQQWPGYYADVEARCQVFHICQANGRSDAFLCPNGTVFSQQYFVCVWWFDFDCATAPQFFELNAQLYAAADVKSRESGPATEVQVEEKMSTSTGDVTEEQGPVSPQITEQSSLPVSEDSQEAISEGTPAEVPTTTLYGSNGVKKQRNGVKGRIGTPVYKNGNGKKNGNGNGQRTNGIPLKANGNGNGKRLNGNGVKPTNGLSTKPVNGNGRKNGNGKKNGNGAPAIPASPATNGRTNGYQNGYQKPNGKVNGNVQQRTNGGTKSAYRPTVQRAELTEEASNRYYRYRY